MKSLTNRRQFPDLKKVKEIGLTILYLFYHNLIKIKRKEENYTVPN